MMNIMLAGNDKVYYGIELVIYSTMAHNKNVHWYIVTMDYEQRNESQNTVHVYKGFQEWQKEKLKKIVNYFDAKNSSIIFIDGKELYDTYSNVKFQYNNCYSYDEDCPGKDAFLGKGTGDGEGVSYSIQNTSTSNANFCPNNFWSVKDAANATKSIFDFTTCNGSQIINVKNQVCETTASGPASLIVRGTDMNLGSAPNVSFTGIKLEADEVLADRYLVGVRPNGEGWTYGAYQTREAKDVEKFQKLASNENLETTVVATVTEEPRMKMYWRGKLIVDLSREFLNTNGTVKSAEAKIEKPQGLEEYFAGAKKGQMPVGEK